MLMNQIVEIRKISKISVLGLFLLCFSFSSCKTVESKPEDLPSQKEEEPVHISNGSPLAIIWTSDDGEHFGSELIEYSPTGIKVLGKSNKLLIWSGNALWTMKSTTYNVKEGNCQTKGGVSRVKKDGSFLDVLVGEPGVSHKQLSVTDPRDVPNATYKNHTQIIGSYNGYVFGLVCTDYTYCYGPHEYPECEFVSYDLLKEKQLMSSEYVKSYPFQMQGQNLFADYVAKGGEMLGDRYPLYVQPVWDNNGRGFFDVYYRMRVRHKAKKKSNVYYDEIVRQAKDGVETKMDVINIPAPIMSKLAGHKYVGISFLPQQHTLNQNVAKAFHF